MSKQANLFVWNNQNLFSNNYLENRLPSAALWNEQKEKAAIAFEEIKKAHNTIGKLRFGPGEEAGLEDKFIRPVLSALGYEWDVQPTTERGTKKKRPDYALFKDRDTLEAARKDKQNTRRFFTQALTILEAKYWDRRLNDADPKDTIDRRDPTAQTVKYLDDVYHASESRIQWAILTNGKVWRLFYYKASSRSGNYFEIDLEEIILRGDAEKFLYFYLFFAKAAFLPDSVTGKTWLNRHLEETEAYASRVSGKLKNLIFDNIFEGLAAGLIEYRRNELAITKETEQDLQDIFKGCLTLLYRLLFLLYAESRGLLPVDDQARYYKKSLKKLKEDIAHDLSIIGLEGMSHNAFDYWSRMESLFRIIDKGDRALNIPVYNGGLFEAHPNGFLNKHKISDPFIAEAIELLTVDQDADYTPGSTPFIDYSSLSVRHLGDIYEGLLEFHVRVADEEIVEVKEKGKHLWKRSSEVKASAKTGRKKTKGDAYIENSNHERKATGSYYTPHYIVEYIVNNTVGPVLQERLGRVETLSFELDKLYEKQRKQLKKAADWKHWEHPGEAKGEHITAIVQKEHEIFVTLFDIKVLDPAMGSGHFLVHAVDFITDKVITFLADYPDSPVIRKIVDLKKDILGEIDRQGVSIDESKLTEVNLIKRMVMKQCIYGVDLNEMAVELAKLSLWLDSFTLGAPLSFLDHHLKCGNSLIGIYDISDVIVPESEMYGKVQCALSFALQVAELTDATVSEAKTSYDLFRQGREAIEPIIRRFDAATARHFMDSGWTPRIEQLAYTLNYEDESYAEVVKACKDALTIGQEKRFFHWKVEFPEVFYTDKGEKDNQGFDCVIGNPPYVNIMLIKDEDATYFAKRFETARRRFDLYILFAEQAMQLLKSKGHHSFIVPDKILSETYGTNLRKLMIMKYKIQKIFDVSQNSIFPDVAVKPIVYVVKKEINDDVQDITVEVLVDGQTCVIKKQIIPQQDFLNVPECRIRLDWTTDIKGLVKKINDSSYPLSRILYISWGAQPGEADKFFFYGKEPTCRANNKNCKAKECPAKKGLCRRLIKGSSISRYSLYYEDAHILYDVQKLHRPAFPALFENEKLVVREVSGNKGLIATCDNDYYYTDHSLINCIPKYYLRTLDEKTLRDRGIRFVDFHRPAIQDIEDKVYNRDTIIYPEDMTTGNNCKLSYILALINSTLVGFYYKKYVSGELNVFPEHVRTLPIFHIAFTTFAAERKDRVAEAIERYEGLMIDIIKELVVGEIASWADRELKSNRNDTIHDLLAFLAGQMIELNKAINAESKGFLKWLEREIGMEIDAMANKTAVKEYHEHAFPELLNVLKKNKNKLSVNPSDRKFQEQLDENFKKSLALLNPLKMKIVATDELIDEIVYKLYGLTEEEVRIVKGES
jgi:hypothetical protein